MILKIFVQNILKVIQRTQIIIMVKIYRNGISSENKKFRPSMSTPFYIICYYYVK